MTTATKSRAPTAATHETFEAFLFDPVDAQREFNVAQTMIPAYHPGDWILLAKVPAAFSQEVRRRERNFCSRVSLADTPSGAAYLSIINQVGGFQCRILMPLFDAKIAQLFSGPKAATLNVSLLSDEPNEAHFFRATFCNDLCQRARTDIKRMETGNKLVYLDEVEQVMAEYKRLKSLPSLVEGEDVKKVCVVFTMPCWVVDFNDHLNEFIFGYFEAH